MQRTQRKTRRNYDEPGDAHELTFSCFKMRPFLTSDRTCQYLADAIVRARTLHAFDVWAYVFMPEHVHLLIWPTREEYSIAAIRKSIKQSVARKALRYLRRQNPGGLKQLATGHVGLPYQFWMEGGGYDRNAVYPKSLSSMVDYIHNNPVESGLVDSADEWYWSSFRQWEGMGDGPVSLDLDSFPES